MTGLLSRPVLERAIPSAVLVIGGLLIPHIIASGYGLRIATMVGVYAILGTGFNLLFGLTGQLSLGQQAFFAIGGYGFAIFQSTLQWPLLVAIVASLAACAAIGLMIGIPVLRLRGHYFAMATAAFGLLVEGLSLRWEALTGGTSGLDILPITLFGRAVDRHGVYYFVFGMVVCVYLYHDVILSGHLGRALRAVRDDEPAAEAMGIDVTRTKVIAFTLSAIFAGLAGCAFAMVSRHVDPSYVDISINIALLTMAVFGGLGSRIGPMLGAVVIIVAQQYLTELRQYELVIFGALLLAFMIFLPRGLAGLIDRPAEGGRR